MNGSLTSPSLVGDADEDKVGNCRPPRSTRFRPGQSGNPRGRPKRARGLSGLVARVSAKGSRRSKTAGGGASPSSRRR